MKVAKQYRVAWIACLLASSLNIGDAGIPRRTTVAVIVNKANPVSNLEITELRRLMLGEIHYWSNQRRVTLVHRDPSSAAYQTSLDLVIHMTAPEYRRFLLNQEFRGEEAVTSKTLRSPDGACEFVFNVPGAIAVVEAEPALLPPCLAWVKVIPVNNKLPGEANYLLQ